MDDDANKIKLINLFEVVPENPIHVIVPFVLANIALAIVVFLIRKLTAKFQPVIRIILKEFIAVVCYSLCYHSQELMLHHLGYPGMFCAILFQMLIFLSVNKKNGGNLLILMDEMTRKDTVIGSRKVGEENTWWYFLTFTTHVLGAVFTSFMLTKYNQLPKCTSLYNLSVYEGGVKPEIAFVLLSEFLGGFFFNLFLRYFNRNHTVIALAYAIISTSSRSAIGVYSAQLHTFVIRFISCHDVVENAFWGFTVPTMTLPSFMGWIFASQFGGWESLKSIWWLRLERIERMERIAAERAEEEQEEEQEEEVPEEDEPGQRNQENQKTGVWKQKQEDKVNKKKKKNKNRF
ncbi:hypothetical protein CRE_07696 [Caenorhabditis remanei]|uniref:Uncharacterized protein n=1 Tax=Caenorhabditis remanei TaxID=31234 RepID=E3MZX8_CAERE|nr:hypothetical protein CRE_07696 [Caenorhabditis remanei]